MDEIKILTSNVGNPSPEKMFYLEACIRGHFIRTSGGGWNINVLDIQGLTDKDKGANL